MFSEFPLTIFSTTAFVLVPIPLLNEKYTFWTNRLGNSNKKKKIKKTFLMPYTTSIRW